MNKAIWEQFLAPELPVHDQRTCFDVATENHPSIHPFIDPSSVPIYSQSGLPGVCWSLCQLCSAKRWGDNLDRSLVHHSLTYRQTSRAHYILLNLTAVLSLYNALFQFMLHKVCCSTAVKKLLIFQTS